MAYDYIVVSELLTAMEATASAAATDAASCGAELLSSRWTETPTWTLHAARADEAAELPHRSSQLVEGGAIFA